MFSLSKITKNILSYSLTGALLFSLNGCSERPLPTDELISIYNSDLEKTNRMKPLDTMYVKVGGLKANEKHEIRILDSDRNLITSTQEYANEDGVIEATPIWYDVGLKKPDATHDKFYVDSGLEIKSFYINVVDTYNNGDDTDFEQPFFYVLKEEAENQEMTVTTVTVPSTVNSDTDAEVIIPDVEATHGTTVNLANYIRPKVYASLSTGEMENAFEEHDSKSMDGTESPLSKVYLKVDELPLKLFNTGTDSDTDITDIDIYIVPFGQSDIEDINLTSKSVASVTKTRTELLASVQEIWDIDLQNPTNENNAYSIVLDINRDGKYTKGIDINGDNLSDVFIDGVDGVYTAGFIVKNTPANEPYPFKLTDTNGNVISSIPEEASGIRNSLYLSIENLATTDNEVQVIIKDESNVTITEPYVGVKTPQANDEIRYLKYIENERIFDIADYNGTDELTVTISTADINFTTTFSVYGVDLNTTTHSSSTSDKVTTFDETNTINGLTEIWMKLGLQDNDNIASIYMFNSNLDWDSNSSLDGSIMKKVDYTIASRTDAYKIFDLDEEGYSIINPTDNNDSQGTYDLIVDYDNNGIYNDDNDTKLTVTIRDTSANEIPKVGYINIASNGYFKFDNHYGDSNQTSNYGYIDEFAVDGSNTRGAKIRAIWNPYLKNKKRGGFYANYWTRGTGDNSVYVDESGEAQQSPFNFGQQLDLYIIDANSYPLKRNMSLGGKDLRGGPQTITTQFSCSNGAAMQSILSRNQMQVGSYYVILDVNKNGVLDDGVDYVDAVTQKGAKITEEDSSVVGFSIVEELTNRSTLWTKQFGTTQYYDYALGVAADSEGNAISVGYTRGSIDDTNTSANIGRYDGFIAKYDKDGNKTFIKQIGTSSYDWITGVVTSGTDIYITGYTYGNMDDTNGSAQQGSYDGFVAKYDKNGNEVFSKQFGTTSTDYINAVTIDSGNNIYVAGYTYGTFTDETRVGSYDGFIVKYNSSGTKQWAKQFGTTSTDYITGVATDSNNNIYVSGYTYGTFDARIGSYDGFIVKYDDNGTKDWTRQFGTTSTDYITSVAVDSSNNIYAVGYSYGKLADETRLGSYDGIIVKYNDEGVQQYAKQFGTSSVDYIKDIAIDSSNNIYATGYTYGTMGESGRFGSYDGVVIKFNTDGSQEWAKQFGTTSTDYVESIATNGTEVYFTGRTSGVFKNEERIGSYDNFVGKVKLSVD